MNQAIQEHAGTGETMTPIAGNHLVEYGITDTKLAELRGKYGDLPQVDAAKPDNYKALVAGIRECRELRTSIEARRKELKADALEWGRKVDAEAKRITNALIDIEEPMKQAKENEDERKAAIRAEEENRERDRVARIRAHLNDLVQDALDATPDRGLDSLQAALEQARLWRPSPELFQEFLPEAQEAYVRWLGALEDAIDKARKAEEEAARLAEEQARLAEQRATQEAEEARLRAEREAFEAEKRQHQEAVEARERAEREAREAAAAEERRKQDEAAAAARAEQEAREKAEREEQERQRIYAESTEILPDLEAYRRYLIDLLDVNVPTLRHQRVAADFGDLHARIDVELDRVLANIGNLKRRLAAIEGEKVSEH